MNNQYPRGSEWRKWDLQVQTILDDGYVSLDSYYEEIKKKDPIAWQEYVAKVVGEKNALLFDSKTYFNNHAIDKKVRCSNYVKNFLAFLETFNPSLKCIGITDHNYFDDQLLDTFIAYSKKASCKVIPGVEINCHGIHMLLLFPGDKKLYNKESFSAGIRTLLSKFDIDEQKKNGSPAITTKNPKDVIDEVCGNGGIIIYAHCNSDNGLFQERTKTDRTLLAEIFNHQEMNLLQAQSYESCLKVDKYINNNSNLISKCCHHISSDSRCLKDIGECDNSGNYLWIKADPTFEGLRQIIYESNERVRVATQEPEQKKPYFVIKKVRFLDNCGNPRFSSEEIPINSSLTTIIGGKSTGKSLLLHYIAKTIDPEEVRNRLLLNGSSTQYDFDKQGDFNFEVTWQDGLSSLLVSSIKTEDELKERKILYIPQKDSVKNLSHFP